MSENFTDNDDAVAYDNMYYLSEQELAFFQSQTGIKDEEELKHHVMSVRAEALTVMPYSCIKAFAFTKLIANRSPVYQQAIAIGKERKGAILVDIGCCYGYCFIADLVDASLAPVQLVSTSGRP